LREKARVRAGMEGEGQREKENRLPAEQGA